jgi:hypothetical protein
MNAWINIWARQIIAGKKKFSEIPESRKQSVSDRIKELALEQWQDLINQ